MQTLKRTNCKHCGKENTVDVHITENEDEQTILIRECTSCGVKSNLSDLFDV